MKKGLLLILLVFSFVIIGCAVEEPIAVEPAQIEEQISEPVAEEKAEEAPEVVTEEEIPAESIEETGAEETIAEEKLEKPKPCGNLFDAYTRIQGGAQDSGDVKESELASLLAARMSENNVGCALLISIDVTDFDTQQQIKESVDYYYNILKLYPNKFVPLLDIDADKASDITVELIKQILEEAKGKIDYKGFGEVSFVDPGPWKSKKLTDEPLPEIIDFLGKNDLIFAAHIRTGQTSELDTVLSQHPDTKILVHGNPSGIKELLAKHKNLYYAAELEVMLKGVDGFGCSPISVTDSIVNSKISEYDPIIEAVPNQVLWATNAASKCHFSQSFYSKLIEFTNQFIERLPEEHRDKFAYENALELFGKSN